MPNIFRQHADFENLQNEEKKGGGKKGKKLG